MCVFVHRWRDVVRPVAAGYRPPRVFSQLLRISSQCHVYRNWFTVGKVIARVKRVNLLLRHSICTPNTRTIEQFGD